MDADLQAKLRPTKRPASHMGAFARPAFAILWTANLISLIGIAMNDAASGWLMTSLNADPFFVSMVQVAASLPMFLFTLPAGALADIFDTRKFLIVAETTIAMLVIGFATLVSLRLATPVSLLVTTFLLSGLWALAAPAWLSITPHLVPRDDLDEATAANTVGYNISRAVGPALGGIAIAAMGLGAPFWIFSACNLVTIAALLWWRADPMPKESLPAERLISALRVGVRHAANNAQLRATLIRAIAFFPFASAFWALLPIVARRQISEGPEFYGILLGAISVGAIVGSLGIKRLKTALGADYLVALGASGAALMLALFGFAHDPWVALVACVLAGAFWIVVMATLYVSAQDSLPDWVRARGLAILLTVIFGATTIGSAVWGKIAAMAGLPTAYVVAAVGAALAIPVTWSWKLQSGSGADLTPSKDATIPKPTQEFDNDRGPVLVSIAYRVGSSNRLAFLGAVGELRRERKRDGGFGWNLFEVAAARGRFIEIFLIESWLEFLHMRQRTTNADRIFEERLGRLLDEPPQITLSVAVEGRRGRQGPAIEPEA